MGFREFNRNKNLFLRAFKAKAGKALFDRKQKLPFLPSSLPKKPKILYLRNDNKLGDMIVSTLSFREVKKRLPGAFTGVICGHATEAFAKNNPNIDQVYLYKRGIFEIISLGLKLRKQKFDLYIDMDEANTIESLFLLWLIKPKYALGFNREDYKSYDISIKFDFNANHISQRHKAVFDALGLIKPEEEIDRSYDIFIPPAALEQVQVFLSKLPKAKCSVLFNMFAASRRRCFSVQQVIEAAQKLPDVNFILSGPWQQLKAAVRRVKLPSNIFIPSKRIYSRYGFFITLALVKETDFTVTPDTSAAHAVSAFDKPSIALYNIKDPANITKWAPLSTKCLILTTDGDFEKFDITKITEVINDYDPKKAEDFNNCSRL